MAKKRQIHDGIAGRANYPWIAAGRVREPCLVMASRHIGGPHCYKADSPAFARSITFWIKPVLTSNVTHLKPHTCG